MDLLVCCAYPDSYDYDSYVDSSAYSFTQDMRFLGFTPMDWSGSLDLKEGVIRFTHGCGEEGSIDVDMRYTHRSYQSERASKTNWCDININQFCLQFVHNENTIFMEESPTYIGPKVNALPSMICSKVVLKDLIHRCFSMNCWSHFPGRMKIEHVINLRDCVSNVLRRIIKFQSRHLILSNMKDVFDTLGVDMDLFKKDGILAMQTWPHQFTGWAYGLRFGCESNNITSVVEVIDYFENNY